MAIEMWMFFNSLQEIVPGLRAVEMANVKHVEIKNAYVLTVGTTLGKILVGTFATVATMATTAYGVYKV